MDKLAKNKKLIGTIVIYFTIGIGIIPLISVLISPYWAEYEWINYTLRVFFVFFACILTWIFTSKYPNIWYVWGLFYLPFFIMLYIGVEFFTTPLPDTAEPDNSVGLGGQLFFVISIFVLPLLVGFFTNRIHRDSSEE